MRAKISLQRETSKTSLLEWTLNLCDCKIWRVTHNEPTINGLSPHIFIDSRTQKNVMPRPVNCAIGMPSTRCTPSRNFMKQRHQPETDMGASWGNMAKGATAMFVGGALAFADDFL